MLDTLKIILGSPFGAALSFFYGTVLGSFTTLLVYRLPRRLPWAWTRSKCPQCGHVLGAAELVPLFSWMFQRGRCKCCRAAIPARYPLIELVFGLWALVVWFLCQ